MKRVLILLLFVLVVGCADTGPDTGWKCPSCGWGGGETELDCLNCGDKFRSTHGSGWVYDTDHLPVKREK